MSVRLAILDLGATLVTGPARGPWSRIAERLGLDAMHKAALREALMTTPFERPEEVAAFLHARGAPGGAAIERAVAEVWSAQCTEAEPIAGAADALAGLRAHGIPLAVISNIWPPYLEAVRVHLGAFLDAHVAPELQLFSFRERCAKPAPELFRRVLERAGVAPAEAVMIGDSYAEDVEPAARLGIPTVWVLHRPQRERSDLTRVLNGEAPAPGRALAAIAGLTPDVLASALAPASRPVHAA